jgi:hypothetical protein
MCLNRASAVFSVVHNIRKVDGRKCTVTAPTLTWNTAQLRQYSTEQTSLRANVSV